MSEYQLQIKQVVDYPRCRIYRQFVQSLITDQGIRTGGGSGLFYFTVLCSYANFRTSYRRIDGISYTVYPGEWICTVKELAGWFRTHFQHQALDTQGVSCFRCPKARYKLYPLSDDWEGKYLCRPHGVSGRRIGMEVCCGNGGQVYTFELMLSPAGGKEMEG